MRKEILLLGTMALAVNAFAQQEAGWVTADNAEVAAAWKWDADTESWAKKSEDWQIAGGTLMIDQPNVVVRTTFDNTQGSASSVNKLSLTYYAVNGVDYRSTDKANNVWEGAVGNDNPGAINFDEGIVINKGWVIDYEVKKDGYLSLIFQPSLNKNIYVIENGEPIVDGALNPEASFAMAYDFYFVTASEPEGCQGTSFSYKLPADEGGYLNFESPEIDNYVQGGCIMWPYRILMGDATAETGDKKYPNANGVVVFPVTEGYHYYFFATGSKVTAGPYVFTEEYPTQLAFVKEDAENGNTVYNLIGDYAAGVEGVAAAEDANAPIYNMMGVRVNADAKGILIQNGKKFIRK